MAAPPMPPGKMPPRPPGMKLMPPMPPGFKGPAGGAPPMPPGKMPPMPPGMTRPGAPPMPPGMARPAAAAGAAPPAPPPGGTAQPRYLVPPGHPSSAAPAGPPPPQQQQQQQNRPPESSHAPRYLMPPGAGGGLPEMPTLSTNAMGAPPPPPEGRPPYHNLPQHARGGYGRGHYDGGRPPAMHHHDDFEGGRYDNRRYGRGGRMDRNNFNNNNYPSRGGYRDRYERGNDRFDRQDRGRRPHMHRRDEPQENPPMREPTNTVWVGSYDPNFHSRAMLCRAFWPFGRVMQISIHDGKSYAFVHMRRTEEAKAAVEALMQSRELGPAIFNFSKHHDYTEEEMNLLHDPAVVEEPPAEEPPAPRQQHAYPPPPQAGYRRPREQDDGEPRDFRDARDGEGVAAAAGARDAQQLPPLRRPRGEREAKEPSNVLWLGNLVPFISNEKLVEIFEVFGPITNVSRLGRSNMAFLTYETVEQCTMALETMRGRPIEGVMLSMNYGHDAQSGNDGARDGNSGGGAGGPGNHYPNVPLTADGIPVNEVPTNIIYLGNLPSDADSQEVERLFLPFDGFIFSKYVEANSIGFGHFDSVETSRAARAALLNATLNGSPIRVSFGKQNHTYTMADRRRIGEPHPDMAGGGDFNLDAMMRGPGGQALDGMSGALVAGAYGGGGMGGGALMLPAMGGGAAGGGMDGSHVNVYAKVRAAPEMTLDSRLQSLYGSTYNGCGASGLEISPSQIQAVCLMVDNCVSESSYETLREALTLYSPLRSVHVFNVVAKRMKEFPDDPHKRLLVLYATTHVLLSANTDYVRFTDAVLNAYLMVLLVASEGQTSSGMDRLTSIIESLQQHPFIEKKSSAGEAYTEEFRAQLEDIANRAKAEQDLRSFVTRRRRRD